MKKLNFVLVLIISVNAVLGDADHHDHDGAAHEDDFDHHAAAAGGRSEAGLWWASVGSILVISLCGIFGVLVIPIMQKVGQL